MLQQYGGQGTRTAGTCSSNRKIHSAGNMPAPTFQEELAVYGPTIRQTAPSLAAAQAYCRRLAQSHYENFSVASLLLPAALRQHFYNVYAYCRWADDLADETASAPAALDLLAWWEGELA